mgnify:CR=1 FL=1
MGLSLHGYLETRPSSNVPVLSTREALHRHVIQPIESIELGVRQALAAFLAVVFARYFLEALLEGQGVLALHLDLRYGLTDFLHVMVSWGVLFILTTLGIALGTGRDLPRINRMVLVCFPVIWLPPLWDFIFGSSAEIVYQHDFSEFTSSFIGLFNPFVPVGYVTPGVRVEVACAVGFVFFYTVLSGRGLSSWLRGLFTGAWVYCMVFLLGFLPAIWSVVLDSDHQSLLGASVLGVNNASAALLWYFPLLLSAGPVWLRYSSPSSCQALRSSVRPSRLLIYLIISGLAFLSAGQIGLLEYDWLNVYDLSLILLMNMALALAFIAMTMLNDLHDREIDQISNADRPLVTGKVTAAEFCTLAWICGVVSLALAVVVDEVAIYPLAITIAIGYLYSAPPFRLRRFVGVAHLCLAGIAGGVYLFGASPVLGTMTFQQIDRGQLLSLMVLFFVGAHFKDIKDIAGDRRCGVVTLPTLLGAQRAYWLIGGLVVVGVAMLLLSSVLINGPTAWLALGLFTCGWLLLRNAERLFWVILVSLGLLFVSHTGFLGIV